MSPLAFIKHAGEDEDITTEVSTPVTVGVLPWYSLGPAFFL